MWLFDSEIICLTNWSLLFSLWSAVRRTTHWPNGWLMHVLWQVQTSLSFLSVTRKIWKQNVKLHSLKPVALPRKMVSTDFSLALSHFHFAFVRFLPFFLIRVFQKYWIFCWTIVALKFQMRPWGIGNVELSLGCSAIQQSVALSTLRLWIQLTARQNDF